MSENEKSVGTSFFSEKSYKNTRTKKSRYPSGYLDFLMLEMGLEDLNANVPSPIFRTQRDRLVTVLF